MHINRGILAKRKKEAYLNGVLSDIERGKRHRHRTARVIEHFNILGIARWAVTTIAEEAEGMLDAGLLAKNSPACEDASDALDCGKKRDEANAVPRHGSFDGDDRTIVDSI